jgi:hypothetical protein
MTLVRFYPRATSGLLARAYPRLPTPPAPAVATPGWRDRYAPPDAVTNPQGDEEILPRILGILEKQIEDSGTIQKFILGLSERVDTLGEASASHEAQLTALRAELAEVRKRLKKAKKK